jgi:hypothetical protein
MEEGKGLLNKVMRLTSTQVEERSDQFIATGELPYTINRNCSKRWE